jgi:hypothetical protein
MLILTIKYDLEESSKISIQWLVVSKTKIFLIFFYIVHISYKHNASQLIESINVHSLAIVTAAVDRIG